MKANIATAQQIMSVNSVPCHLYVIGDEAGNYCWTIRRRGEGWQVFYNERGSELNMVEFDTEDEAVRFFIRKTDQVLRDEEGRSLDLSVIPGY